MADVPLVSVCCITYNQEKFVKEALDSFVMQETDFPFEVIISDDNSTDDTRKIITEYAKKYPDIIKPVFHKKNLGSLPNYLDNFLRARSKYVAMCEGDDYWTDPKKLQKQVDFMEANPDTVVCFHPVTVHYEGDSSKDFIFPEAAGDFTLDRLLEGNFIQTNSVMYRRQNEYVLGKTDFVPGDWYLHVYHARLGRIGYINSNMGVYRKHDEGLWSGSHGADFWNKYATRHIEFCNHMLALFPDDQARRDKVMLLASRLIYEIINKADDIDRTIIEDLCKKYPGFIAEYILFFKKVIDEKQATMVLIDTSSRSYKLAQKIATHAHRVRAVKAKASKRLKH